MFDKAPELSSLKVPLVWREPSERFRLAMLVPFEFSKLRVVVLAAFRSKVVEPPVKGMLVSAIDRSLKVLAPVKVCVVLRSARVIAPVGIVAVVPPEPVVKVTALAPDTAKLPSSARVPVVQVGADVPPERRA